MPHRVAYKRLSAVEIDPSTSHQHELHAGGLRAELGFPVGRTEGAFSLVTFESDESDAANVDDGRFTIYDARERHPSRSEYRLYYDLQTLGEAGDLLVLFREEDGSLVGLVAKPGTRVERDLLAALDNPDPAAFARFRYGEAAPLTVAAAEELADALTAVPATPPDYPSVMADFLTRVGAERRIPSGREMTEAAREALDRVHGSIRADEQLFHGLEAETDLYFAAEEAVKGVQLRDLQERSADLIEVTAFVLRLLQSRKARRGQSLQNHFAMLLDGERIPYTPQCETEPGERPDFIVPGCSQYRDPSHPTERLRLVACKTTVRERWRQILNEGARVPEKYLLTVDRTLTHDTIDAMGAASLRVFLPAPLITSTYPMAATRLRTVGELVEDLHTIT